MGCGNGYIGFNGRKIQQSLTVTGVKLIQIFYERKLFTVQLLYCIRLFNFTALVVSSTDNGSKIDFYTASMIVEIKIRKINGFFLGFM